MSDKKIIDQVKTTVTENNNATSTISVIAPFALIQDRQAQAFKDLSKNIKIDGFRKGKIPADVAKKHLPELLVLEQAGRDLIADLYLPLLQKHKIDAIGEPQISIKKLAQKNDFEFDITFTLAPKVVLGDYQKITAELTKDTIDPQVTDEELDQAIQALRQQWAQHQEYTKQLESATTDTERAKLDPRLIQVDESDWPELTDTFVKDLGNHESVDDFKTSFKINIKANKALEEVEKRRAEALMKLVEQSEFSVPELVYESETSRMIDIRKSEVKEAGLSWSEYLKSINKTEDQLRQAFVDTAKSRVHQQLVINELATVEKLEPTPDEVNTEVEFLAKRYPSINKSNIVAYVYSQLMAQKALHFLVPPTKTDLKTPKVAKKGKKASKKPKANSKDSNKGKKDPKKSATKKSSNKK